MLSKEAKLAAIDSARDRSDLAALEAYLSDPDPGVCFAAADDLKEIGGEAGAAVLLRHLGDSHPLIRCISAEAQGRHRHRPGVAPLVTVILNDKDDLVRVCAAEALGDIGEGSPEVVSALTEALRNDHAHLVRAYAAESLGRLGIKTAAGLLRQRLRHERSLRSRVSILEALARLGDAQGLPSLLRAVSEVRQFKTQVATLNLLLGLANKDNVSLIERSVLDVSHRDRTFAEVHKWFFESLRKRASGTSQ